ncbi:restriction endonuclease [Actinoplanes lobatus]|uniref:Restriction endonuclease n=1 Tax=Actinoplanes lobatus TaxID=113568 RepID=A0A7W7HQX3_9ACTN|nr:restriction endonuclease [Actinoplanes lobatus]MBB4755051.1 restriction system protein [Actinoplanes lobatus]GGN82337.1 restriction endonuclease [Actinoplanes lobatus]GIE40631.1 restriction endonuclease [Actinoplanes lobatus]
MQQNQLKQAQRDQRDAERAAAAAARDERAKYCASRRDEAERRTADVTRWVAILDGLLLEGIRRTARIDLQRFKRTFKPSAFDAGSLATPAQRPEWRQFEPAAPGMLSTIFGGRERHAAAVSRARRRFDDAMAFWEARERDRHQHLVQARAAFDARMAREQAECAEHNRQIDAEIEAFSERRRPSVERYCEQVLSRLLLPPDFPRRAEVAYNRDAEQVVVQLQLPGTDVVPTAKTFRYIQSGQNADTIVETKRPDSEIKRLYRDVIAQVTLLAIRDLFDADEHLREVAFNGHVDSINPATGRQEYPCLISLDVERAAFEELVLDRVRPADCLPYLRARVSEHPYALMPIEPILVFDLSKFAFIEGLDAVSTLDHRPDLMQMGHGEFEHLVRQVFEAMGMQGWTTTSSKDDGVDAVVKNPDPFVGGVTIIQAKHYKNVVGVNHIRELAGAMEEKKAGRGILVTTSWFTSGGRQKAYEHGRMQLVDGQNLIFLIKKYTGKDVVISVKRPKNAASIDQPDLPED